MHSSLLAPYFLMLCVLFLRWFTRQWYSVMIDIPVCVLTPYSSFFRNLWPVASKMATVPKREEEIRKITESRGEFNHINKRITNCTMVISHKVLCRISSTWPMFSVSVALFHDWLPKMPCCQANAIQMGQATWAVWAAVKKYTVSPLAACVTWVPFPFEE